MGSDLAKAIPQTTDDPLTHMPPHRVNSIFLTPVVQEEVEKIINP
jgi:hypothetical protein